MRIPLISKMKSPNNYSRPMRDLVVLGSSSSEVFDYVIGKNSFYHPFWAGAWSARGLRNKEMQSYIKLVLSPFEKDTCIFLNFGLADVIFNARYKANTEGFYDFKRIVTEAANGIILTKKNIEANGFRSVFGVFIAPVTPHDQNYWFPMGPGRQLPNAVMGTMYYDLFNIVSNEMKCIDTFNEMSLGKSGSYLLKDEFVRENADHHPDYLKMHEIIKAKLLPIKGLPEPRQFPLESLYQYENFFVKDLLKEGKTRPNTCK